jgi:hypothetical protein
MREDLPDDAEEFQAMLEEGRDGYHAGSTNLGWYPWSSAEGGRDNG